MYIRKHDDDNNGESCNVGDSSVLHCVSCTAHNNTQQNIMAALISLPESSHARKMGVLKGMVGKKRWKFVAKKEKTDGRKF